MNKELLDFLEAQLNSGLDNDTAMRAAINKGYDYVDVSSAIASLGQKKKSPYWPKFLKRIISPGYFGIRIEAGQAGFFFGFYRRS